MTKVILIVDDNQQDRKFVTRAVNKVDGDISVVSAENGRDALEQLATMDAPSLIVLDLDMPEMDGKELLRKLKDDIELRSIPAIVLSTSDSSREVRECYDLNANAYLVKPDTALDYKRIVQRVRDFWLEEAKLAKAT